MIRNRALSCVPCFCRYKHRFRGDFCRGYSPLKELLAGISTKHMHESLVFIDSITIVIIVVLERHTRIRRRAVLSESAPPPLPSCPSGQTGVVEAERKYERNKPYPLHV